MTEGWGIVKEITLSSTKQQVKIVTNDFVSVAQHLLTNPQIKWEDYLWFDDDPLAGPPDNLDYVADINTPILCCLCADAWSICPKCGVLPRFPLYSPSRYPRNLHNCPEGQICPKINF
jgi:hypothetical protein